MSNVILVTEQDEPIGYAEKLQAHKQGWLHRAFSVFVLRYNHVNEKETLLQQRQNDKYHCGGLWTNSCCSHPQPHETIETAASQRLQEELGFTVPLRELGSFMYRAELSNGLIEYEFDHVLCGYFTDNITIVPNPKEVMAYRWVSLQNAEQEANMHPHRFTPWFLRALHFLSETPE